MDLRDLAEVLATTEDHPRARSRVLYLVAADDGLEPAGFADAVGDVVTVLDRLDTTGADGLAVLTRVGAPGAPDDSAPARPVAVVAARDGAFAVAIADDHGGHVVVLDRPPRPDDDPGVQLAWRFVVHALAALDASAAIPAPPDDPHPAAYLTAAWLVARLEEARLAPAVLDDLDLPDEAGLVAALGLAADCSGWDAVLALAERSAPVTAARLGRHGVAWEANVLVGDPGHQLTAVAASGRLAVADGIFDDLLGRGWARPLDTP